MIDLARQRVEGLWGEVGADFEVVARPHMAWSDLDVKAFTGHFGSNGELIVSPIVRTVHDGCGQLPWPGS